ncbi:MAG: DNA primase [Acidobacteriota bacterium]|nr:DNA primase [Blastocatellia bacterium]MDW8411094.1 DNA primase [Acidobacteriota bacterium]
MKSFAEEVKQQADIVRIVSEYVSLKKRGQNYVAKCPFHDERTPSFNVNPAKQIFHCFGCGAGGDVFSFVMQAENCSFTEAVRLVADRFGITITLDTGKDNIELRQQLLKVNALAEKFFSENLGKGAEGKRARKYLLERGLTERTIEKLKLGYALDKWDALSEYLKSSGIPNWLIEQSGLVVAKESTYYDRFRGRCIFPIADAQGRTVAFGGRSLTGVEPKYLNSPETALYTKSRNLYGLHLARESIRKQGFAILVEGYLDFCILYQAGISNVVASLGTALTEQQAKLLARYLEQPRIVVNFDPDAAGVAATKRSIEVLIEQGFKVNVLTLPDGEDPDTFVRKHGAAAYRQLLKESQPYFEYLVNCAISGQPQLDKVAVLNSVMPFLAKMPDRIERAEYAEKLADRLKLESKAIRDELKKAAIEQKQQIKPRKVASIPFAEKRLLELMLADEKLCKRAVEAIDADVIAELATKPLFEQLKQLVSEGLQPDYRKLESRLSALADEQAAFCLKKLPELLLATVETNQAHSEVDSALTALKRTYLERQMARLQIEINEAQKAGNTAKATELSLKKLDLCKQLSQHF